MKKIPLTQEKFAIVDDEDFDYLNQWKWYFSPVGYATRYSGTGRKNRAITYMHQQINCTPKGLVTDHINRDKLNNRKNNLRSIKRGQNQWNRGIPKNNKSGHIGVMWSKPNKKWQARIKINYKEIYLGYYKKITDAIKVRKRAELKYFNLWNW